MSIIGMMADDPDKAAEPTGTAAVAGKAAGGEAGGGQPPSEPNSNTTDAIAMDFAIPRTARECRAVCTRVRNAARRDQWGRSAYQARGPTARAAAPPIQLSKL